MTQKPQECPQDATEGRRQRTTPISSGRTANDTQSEASYSVSNDNTTKRTTNQQPSNDQTATEGQHQTNSQADSIETHDSRQATSDDAGDVPAVDAVSHADGTPASPRPRESLHITVKQRLEQEGRWHGQIELERDEMMRMSKERFPDKTSRREWVYGELDRMYPPIEKPEPPPAEPAAPARPDDGQIQGLGTLPAEWPELPANAPLASEVGWVQANRLRMVSEKPSGATVVDLGLALSPAPSWSALGWLETSIRSYAKFVDVAAKATASVDDEASSMRRERLAIAEMEGLLQDMIEPGDVPDA